MTVGKPVPLMVCQTPDVTPVSQGKNDEIAEG
jgi:hypothetical protein